ncbi:aldo/keto reductase [Pontibacter sp. SGAir0037]|uniref:aldo/keto reductase n=1 Tax=Pontibacter sp. SGAir0037 TaxID=2571030 RepID=UPI0010CCF8FE|nr:aldo/keto reductase [Pontibacter sp. SGAir0037]QCR23978.1 L-fucose dehydrogenase [Pontibacter sp. SGAir0037]
MLSRRNFISKAAISTTAAAFSPILASAAFSTGGDHNGAGTYLGSEPEKAKAGFRLPDKFGIGGVAIGNAFHVNTNEQTNKAMEAAWNAGTRYFDTSPFYGYGLSERRMGHFLFDKKREDFILSTKVGRIFEPDPNFKENPDDIWKGKLNFKFKYDYSAEGVRKSIEDSLLRLGLASIDIVFIHDLSPDNGDMKDNWTDYFEKARKGAMPELTRMREEGIIKAWGLGVNRIEPILKTLEVADPDIMLSATQYSLMYQEDALNRLFPACEKNNVSIVVGAPLNAGFLAGKDRYNYGNTIPDGYVEKRNKMNAIAKRHKVDLRTAALQFSAAPAVVTAVIPGVSNPKQSEENVASMKTAIPKDFWKELKKEKLIAANAPEPK